MPKPKPWQGEILELLATAVAQLKCDHLVSLIAQHRLLVFIFFHG